MMPFGEPVAYLALGTVVLGTPAVIAVCYAKGEPPVALGQVAGLLTRRDGAGQRRDQEGAPSTCTPPVTKRRAAVAPRSICISWVG